MGKVKYNQPGYSGCSMSLRAREAYMSGEMPKSKWTKQAMLDAIKDCCKEFGIEFDRTRMRYDKATLFAKFFEWKSWHHTGKYANVTDFYGLNEEAVVNHFEGRTA